MVFFVVGGHWSRHWQYGGHGGHGASGVETLKMCVFIVSISLAKFRLNSTSESRHTTRLAACLLLTTQLTAKRRERQGFFSSSFLPFFQLLIICFILILQVLISLYQRDDATRRHQTHGQSGMTMNDEVFL